MSRAIVAAGSLLRCSFALMGLYHLDHEQSVPEGFGPLYSSRRPGLRALSFLFNATSDSKVVLLPMGLY